MCPKVLFKRRESTPGVISRPSDQLPGVWTIVAKLLSTAESFNEDVRNVRRERETLLKLLGRNLFVDDRLTRGLGDDGGYFLPAIQCLGGAERLALIMVGLGENRSDELTRVPDGVDVGHLGPGGVGPG